ncbi:MAG: NUDIX domain-containing protein [Ginsengibacter sp.]
MKNILAAGGIVTNEKNELLLIYRYSKWNLPKGHVEAGESFEHCALREVKEETGLKEIEITRFIGTTQHEYFDKYLHEEAVKETHWFLMNARKDDTLIPQLEEDIQLIKWVTIKELPFILSNSYKNIIGILKTAGIYQDMK